MLCGGYVSLVFKGFYQTNQDYDQSRTTSCALEFFGVDMVNPNLFLDFVVEFYADNKNPPIPSSFIDMDDTAAFAFIYLPLDCLSGFLQLATTSKEALVLIDTADPTNNHIEF